MSQEPSSGAADKPERLRRFTRTLQELGTARDVDETLQLMVDLATELIDGIDFADIMFVRGGELTTPVATYENAFEADEAQRDTGEGPCLTTLRNEDLVVSHDLEQEDRWPRFTPRALDLGIRSIAAYRLFHTGEDGEEQYGALNLFGTHPGLDDFELELGRMFADYCAAVLAAAIKEEGVEITLLSREIIGQAKGILMVRHRLTPDEAYTMLRELATDHDIDVNVLATQIIAGTTSFS